MLLREQKNISREQMADALGVHVNTYKNIEYGKKIPNLEEIKVIAKILDVDPINFLYDDFTSKSTNGNHSGREDTALVKDRDVIIDFNKSVNKFVEAIEKFASRQK
mgnify:CR=1 FL=1